MRRKGDQTKRLLLQGLQNKSDQFQKDTFSWIGLVNFHLHKHFLAFHKMKFTSVVCREFPVGSMLFCEF